MKRRQVRTMIRSEAVILAIFGAIIGIIVGTGMGVALVSSLKQQGITDTVVPVSNLVIFLVLAALLGLVSASWPARRAARLDVLAAITAQLCAHQSGGNEAENMHHRSPAFVPGRSARSRPQPGRDSRSAPGRPRLPPDAATVPERAVRWTARCRRRSPVR